jgi:hypothetical protein
MNTPIAPRLMSLAFAAVLTVAMLAGVDQLSAPQAVAADMASATHQVARG